MVGDWFYVSGEEELGPFSTEQVQELLARGEIGPDTMLRKKSWMDWQRVGSGELLLATPTPLDATGAEHESSSERDRDALAPLPIAEPEPGQRVLAGAAIGVLLLAISAWGLYLAFRPGAGRPLARPPRGSMLDASTTVQPEPSRSPSRASVSPLDARTAVYDEASPEDQDLLDWLEPQAYALPAADQISFEDQELLDWLNSQVGLDPGAFQMTHEDHELLDWLDSQIGPGPVRPAKSSAMRPTSR